jgi:hypothetical protein
VKPAAAVSVDVPITLVRVPRWAAAGALSTQLRVTSGPCSPSEQAVGFADGESAPQRITVRATDIGTCVLRLVGGDVATDPITTTVQIVPELTGVSGAIAFPVLTQPNVFKPTAAASVDVPITIVRTPLGASTGAISTHLQVTFGPSGPLDQVVGFADGETPSPHRPRPRSRQRRLHHLRARAVVHEHAPRRSVPAREWGHLRPSP